MSKKVLGGTGGFWEKGINKKIGFTFFFLFVPSFDSNTTFL
jgi:hypothetical protein